MLLPLLLEWMKVRQKTRRANWEKKTRISQRSFLRESINKRIAFVKHVKHVPLSRERAFPAREDSLAMVRHVGGAPTPPFPFWSGVVLGVGVGVGVGFKSDDGGRGGRRAGKLIYLFYFYSSSVCSICFQPPMFNLIAQISGRGYL